MVVTPVIDPGDKYRLTVPLITWNETTGAPGLVLYPRAVEIDWNAVRHEETYANTLARESNWRRYPSLPGRPYTRTPYGDWEQGPFESFRIWDLWPIDIPDVELIEASIERWWESDPMVDYEHWVTMMRGDWDFCSLAQDRGAGLPHSHEHAEEPGYGGWSYNNCKTGERMFEELEHKVAVYRPEDSETGDGVLPWIRPLPGPTLPSTLAPAWESLLASSEVNSVRALGAFPPWDSEVLLSSERNYSPWLWLC